MRVRGTLLLVLLGLLGIGCGKGLTVNLTADPDPADPGESVTWTLTVRNNTQCATIGEMVDLPPPFPDQVGVFALFVGFDPTIGPGDAEAFCRDLMNSDCTTEGCLRTRFEEALGPETAQVISDHAHAAMQAAHEPQQAGTCSTIINDNEGVIAICAFDPLDPGETDTATHMDTAPNTGNKKAAQIAIAFGFAEGEDCRPGTEIDENIWALTGCFPAAAAEPVPVLSPLALGVGALGLLLTGFLGVRHLRRP
jgi:hypothetical protein